MTPSTYTSSLRYERNILTAIAVACYALVLCALPLFFIGTIGENLLVATWCWGWSRAARTSVEHAKSYHRLYREAAKR